MLVNKCVSVIIELYSVTEPVPSVSAAPLETRSEHSAGTVTQSSSSASELPAQGIVHVVTF